MFLGLITDLNTLDGKYPLNENFAYCCFDSSVNSFIIGYNKAYVNGYGVQLALSHFGKPKQRQKADGVWGEWVSLQTVV